MHSGAAAVAAANAVKAVGAIVHVAPEEFLTVLSLVSEPLVVVAEGGVFSKHYKYLVGHKGMVFYTKSPTPLCVTKRVEWIHAQSIGVPA